MTHFKMKAAVHLILNDGDKTLLSLRKNTGYMDGCYGLVAGHMDGGESPMFAMCREAEEEIGLHVVQKNLILESTAHILRLNGSEYALWFFSYNLRGKIHNREPEKCASLEWVDPRYLPLNTVSYVREVLTTRLTYYEWNERHWA